MEAGGRQLCFWHGSKRINSPLSSYLGTEKKRSRIYCSILVVPPPHKDVLVAAYADQRRRSDAGPTLRYNLVAICSLTAMLPFSLEYGGILSLGLKDRLACNA